MSGGANRADGGDLASARFGIAPDQRLIAQPAERAPPGSNAAPDTIVARTLLGLF
jgi:hypothetical protein